MRDPQTLKRLYDLGELRLSEMDEAGIDVQILSHGAPSAQKLSGADAVDITRRVNDRLHAVVTANPKRFAAFAALPHVHANVRERDESGRPWQYQSRSRVLVVNSGLGILGRDEEDLLRLASASDGE